MHIVKVILSTSSRHCEQEGRGDKKESSWAGPWRAFSPIDEAASHATHVKPGFRITGEAQCVITGVKPNIERTESQGYGLNVCAPKFTHGNLIPNVIVLGGGILASD